MSVTAKMNVKNGNFPIILIVMSNVIKQRESKMHENK